MTSDDFLLVIDQEGHVESKRLDALSDLADFVCRYEPWGFLGPVSETSYAGR
jgi:hypothetical protein